ncbi:MAG: RNA polymerase sigma factor [Candidatus Neomarinimicrobiota bacterium]|nr:MAG: sigma-70 family RNA polymerase sigma factor [bacterium]|tara:strand:- start:69 stop:596 length:528 start_codon:yes stop_codon:yes gene_type:complete
MKKDQELIQDFQNGNEEAFNELVRRYLDLVHGFFQKLTNDEMEAEDLAQTVFIKLFKSLKKFRFESEFNTYLYRVNANTANTYFKRNKWRNILHLDQMVEPSFDDNQQDREWKKEELWSAISRLPKKQRSVVMMRISEMLPFKDIGNILDMSEGTAKVNFHHGIKRIKVLLGIIE